MTINVGNSTVGPSSGSVRRARARQQQPDGSAQTDSLDNYAPPKSRAHLNFIPSPESLATLINGAVAALRKGVYWDRGSILNLVA